MSRLGLERVPAYSLSRRVRQVAAWADLAGIRSGEDEIQVKDVGKFARDSQAAGQPWIPTWLHPRRGGGKYSLVTSIMAGELADPQVGTIVFTGATGTKIVAINGTEIGASGFSVGNLANELVTAINAEPAVNTVVQAEFDEVNDDGLRVTSLGPPFTMVEVQDTDDEMTVTQALTRVAMLPTEGTAGAWSKTEADNGAVTDQGAAIQMLTDQAQAESLAELVYTHTGVWPADKRLVVLGEWGTILCILKGGITAADQARSAVMLIQDTRVAAAHQLAYCTRVPEGFAGGFVRWSDGLFPSAGGGYRNGGLEVRPMMIDIGPRNTGGTAADDPLVQHRASTLDDGCVVNAHGGKTGTLDPAVNSVSFRAFNMAIASLTGPARVDVASCAIYLET